MNRQGKEAVVAALQKDLDTSSGLFLVGYRGMTVEQLQRLRRKVRQNSGKLKVVKVRLIKRALAGYGLDSSGELEPFLKNQVALVFAGKESSAIAKALYEFSKEHESLKLVAGYIDSAVYESDALVRVALLPSREVLLSQLCRTLKTPITHLAAVLQITARKLVIALEHISHGTKS